MLIHYAAVFMRGKLAGSTGRRNSRLADAVAGTDLPDILSSPAANGIESGWWGHHRDAIGGTGYVVRSLQAAV